MSAHRVRRVKLGTSEQLDELARKCGRLYTQTLVSFWRTVRRKGIWLKPKHLVRWHTSPKLHAHTADACVQAFFAALKSWREYRKSDPDAKPPHKRKRFFRIEYKRSAMLLLCRGARLWPVSAGRGGRHRSRRGAHGCRPRRDSNAHFERAALAFQSTVPRTALQAELNSRIDGRMKRGSKRRKRMIRSTKKQLKKIEHQIREIEHKQTSRLITTLCEAGVPAAGHWRCARSEATNGCWTYERSENPPVVTRLGAV